MKPETYSDNPPMRGRILLYFLPASASFISFLYFISFLFLMGYYRAGMFNLVFCTIYLATYIFYLLDRYDTGKTFLILIFGLQAGMHAVYFFPQESLFQLYFIAVTPLFFLLFDTEQIRARYSCLIAFTLMMLLLQIRPDTRVRPFNFTHYDIELLHNANLIICFLILAISSLFAWHHIRRGQLKPQTDQTHDLLTGFSRRRTFCQQAGHLTKDNSDTNSQWILCIGIDNFDQIKDRYGKKAFDQAVIHVAEQISKRCKNTDATARTGDAEFLLLLTGMNHDKTASMAQEMIQSTAIVYRAESGRSLSISIGMAGMNAGDQNIEQTSQRAATALRQARSGGTGQLSKALTH